MFSLGLQVDRCHRLMCRKIFNTYSKNLREADVRYTEIGNDGGTNQILLVLHIYLTRIYV